jgi:hypothetical protein
MPPPYISNCFWTYPTTSTIAAGQVLGFEVVVPPPSTVAGTVAFPVSGSSVSWSLQDTASPPNSLVPGVDYHIVEGDLSSPRLAVVFKPPTSDKQIQIVPILSLFYAGITKPETSTFTAQTFTLKPVTSDAIAQAQAALANALSLTTENSIIEPGDLAILNIAPKNVLDIPQVVTSVLHETPEVKIRGAIPLDNIIQAFLSPVTSTFGQFVPGSKSVVNKAAQEVRSLLGGLFTIPVTIDVLGDKVTKTLAPLGSPQIPLLSASPDGQSLNGVIPIGSWPAGFSMTSVTWEVKENGAATVYNDLSPGVNLVKSFLLRPNIVAMSTTSEFLAPTPITVTATLHIKIDIYSTAIDIQLPSITLQRLPLPLPQLAAVFRHALDDIDNAADQRVYLTCDSQTAPFLSSVNDCTNLIASMTSVLNKIIAVATTLGTDWTDFLNLATAFSVLADRVGRISLSSANPGYIYFQPCLCEQPGACINLSKTSWNNAVSAVIAIGNPSTNGFVLSDADGDGYIAFGASSSYSSILPSLDGTFSDIQQIPPFSALTNQPTKNLNDKLEVLGYGGVALG